MEACAEEDVEPMAAGSFRLVACDLDGTLLNEQGQLTTAVKRTIRAAQAAGVVICLATSRRLTGAVPVAEELGFRGPLILYDGALVRTFPDGETLLSKPLSAQVGQDVVSILAEHGLEPIVQHIHSDRERLFVGAVNPALRHSNAYLSRFADQIVEFPVASLCLGHPDPLRIVAFGPLERLRRAARDVAQLACGWQLLERGNYGAAELSIFAPEASKGNALRWLAQYLDVPLEQTLAIGDGINDVSMLRAVGLGVAMGNADPATKAVARAVTATNEDDGVVQALTSFVLDGIERRGAATS